MADHPRSKDKRRRRELFRFYPHAGCKVLLPEAALRGKAICPTCRQEVFLPVEQTTGKFWVQGIAVDLVQGGGYIDDWPFVRLVLKLNQRKTLAGEIVMLQGALSVLEYAGIVLEPDSTPIDIVRAANHFLLSVNPDIFADRRP